MKPCDLGKIIFLLWVLVFFIRLRSWKQQHFGIYIHAIRKKEFILKLLKSCISYSFLIASDKTTDWNWLHRKVELLLPIAEKYRGRAAFVWRLPWLSRTVGTCVTGRIMVPKDIQALVPGNCEYVTLHGKRDFTEVIKVWDGKITLGPIWSHKSLKVEEVKGDRLTAGFDDEERGPRAKTGGDL